MKGFIFNRRIFLSIVISYLLMTSCQAFELDMSVDEEIRRNYNPSAIENNLPSLPKTAPTKNVSDTPSPPKTAPITEPTKPQIGVKTLPSQNIYDKSTAIRIKKGTKFKVKSTSVISDFQKEGTRVSFMSTNPVSQRYVTIPAGTRFTAQITDSHLPQFTGNGGLIVLKVDSMTYNGYDRSIDAKITKANLKKIFFNNIKGKRQYWRGVTNQINKGQSFYKKSRNASNKVADYPLGIIVAPIPTIVGLAVYSVNLVGSPIFAIWCKGGRISIPQGSEFEIKLLEDVYLN